jgi:flavin-dependent dehydrogenase
MTATRYDVVIIGAGPAGAAASRRLVQGGMKTLLIEKYKLPRRKMCSGLLSRWTVDFVHRHFGPMPETVYTETPFLKGFGFNFPSLSETVLAPTKNPLPYVRRDRFDCFLAQGSGAEIKDGVRLTGIEQEKDGFKILCSRLRKDGKTTRVTFRARYAVAADGMNSRAVRCVMPDAQRGMPVTTGMQKFYRAEIDLDPDYFHLVFHPNVGFFPWVNMKGERVVVGVSGLEHRKAIRYYDSFVALLEEKFGLKIKEVLREEAMAGYMMACLNHFVLGQGNFLVAGDAAGFIHGAEGISAALVSGDLAAQAILQADELDSKAVGLYRKCVRPEVDRCLDNLNPLRMSQNAPMLVDGKALRAKQSLKSARLIYEDLKAFAAQDIGLKETGMGKVAKQNMIHYLFHRSYPVDL